MKNFAKQRAISAFGISTLALVAAASLSTPAFAQATATLRGHVEGATVGTAITATDVVTGQRVTGTVNESGDYTLVGLRPSNYRIEVAGQPPQMVQLAVGTTITLDIGQPVNAPAAADVVVTGRRATEVRTATVGTNVTPQQIENLPQNDRNFLNFAALAPGVTVSPSSGNRRIQAGAVSSDQTNVFIDGLSLKNPVNHGGVVGQNFSQGNPFPQLAVQEFRVDTQNFKAEFEQAGSAIITAVTKTGGEKFHGDAFGEFQPKAFIGRPYFDRPGNANNPNGTIGKPDYKRWQYGADIGGPIIRDKLHFFFAFEGTSQTNPSTNVFLDTAQGIPQSLASQYNGSYPTNFKQQLYFGKLTLFASGADTINGSVFVRKEDNVGDFGGTGVPTHGRDLQSNVNVYQLEWNHRGDRFLNEFTAAYQTATNGTPRLGTGPEILLSEKADFGELAQLGAASFVQNDRQRTATLKDNMTFTGDKHVVKAGAKLTFNKYERLEDFRNNGSYYFLANGFNSFDASTPYAARISTIPVQPASANNTQIGLFIQDDWNPNPNLTINAGIRWDFETNAKNENFVTPANVVAALRAYQPWKAAGINPDDYISTGHNRHPFYGAFQPRLGIAYDINADRDLILFAGAGRYYDRPLFIAAGIETIKNYYQSISTIVFCNPGTTTPAISGQTSCTQFTPGLRDVSALRAAAIAQGTGGDVWLLNNKTKLPYSDEIDIGVRKRFGSIQTSITLSHIRSHNIFQYVRGNRLPSGQYTSQGDRWVEDFFPPEGQLPGFSGKLNIGANGGKADYTAVYVQAEKPFQRDSKWGFTASFTWQRARTNDAQELGSDEFYNGPRQDAYGWEYVAGVDKYRFVGTGIVRGPFNTTLSGTLTLASGPAFGQVIFPANAPENACCYGNFGGVFFPKPAIAYKTLDARIAKTVRLPWGHELTIDFQAYNLFDWVNRSYSAWGAGSGPNPTLKENGTVGNARSFQAGLKYSF